jgi:hypothetical protein
LLVPEQFGDMLTSGMLFISHNPYVRLFMVNIVSAPSRHELVCRLRDRPGRGDAGVLRSDPNLIMGR